MDSAWRAFLIDVDWSSSPETRYNKTVLLRDRKRRTARAPPTPKVSKMLVQFYVQNFVHFLSKTLSIFCPKFYPTFLSKFGGVPPGPPPVGGTPGGAPPVGGVGVTPGAPPQLGGSPGGAPPILGGTPGGTPPVGGTPGVPPHVGGYPWGAPQLGGTPGGAPPPPVGGYP